MLEAVRVAAILLQPVIPDAAARALDRLGVDPRHRSLADASTPLPASLRLSFGDNVILFERHRK
jgi:methionyl-tRNA synthetase